jgi:hypothetical protein
MLIFNMKSRIKPASSYIIINNPHRYIPYNSITNIILKSTPYIFTATRGKSEMSFTSTLTENNNNGKLPSSPSTQSWNFSGDKLKDDLRLFTTGSFYDCTFRVSNDATNESKVIIFKFILLL